MDCKSKQVATQNLFTDILRISVNRFVFFGGLGNDY